MYHLDHVALDLFGMTDVQHFKAVQAVIYLHRLLLFYFLSIIAYFQLSSFTDKRPYPK